MPHSQKPLLLLLAHAGGSVMMYRYLFTDLEKYFQIEALELAGHGRRLSEPLPQTLEEMNEDFVAQVLKIAPQPRPTYIMGHSLGAQNAYLLIQSLSKRGFLASECHFIASSSYPPGYYGFDKSMLDLPLLEFWKTSAKAFSSTQTSSSPAEEAKIAKLFAPVLKADLKAITLYNPQHAKENIIDWPITAISAKEDLLVEDKVKEWKNYTSNSFKVKKVSGDHFFLLDNPSQLIEIIVKTLSQKNRKLL